jgi:RNA ligase
MFYEFPVGMTLDEVRGVVNRHNERCGAKLFIEADKGSYIVFNYLISCDASFPHPSTGDPVLDREYAILRECRGIIFSKKTGKKLASRYHKFFNINEKAETQSSVIDWDRPHYLLLKVDGSMITSFTDDDGVFHWGTKMGATDVAGPVKEFVSKHPYYEEFSKNLQENGKTAIFEWMSRQQKIVIDYPKDTLMLTAIRDTDTGVYATHDEMVAAVGDLDIPVVDMISGNVGNIDSLIEKTRDTTGIEGYVIRFDDGSMLKLKCLEYVTIHRAKDAICSEKDVWKLFIEDSLDDIKPLLPEEDRDSLDRFSNAFRSIIDGVASNFATLVAEQKKIIGDDKKAFAIGFVSKRATWERGLLFKIWEGKEATEVVCDFISNNVSTRTKIDLIRPIFGNIKWSDYKELPDGELDSVD